MKLPFTFAVIAASIVAPVVNGVRIPDTSANEALEVLSADNELRMVRLEITTRAACMDACFSPKVDCGMGYYLSWYMRDGTKCYTCCQCNEYVCRGDIVAESTVQ